MPTTKQLIVLANSIKHHPCTCIAGRELVSDGSHYRIGPWIRPITEHDDGAISLSEARLKGGLQPQVLDFIEVPLQHPTRDPVQPENWLIDRSARWQKVNGLHPLPSIVDLAEAPDHLWYARDEQSDRISSAALQRDPPAQSLYLIHVPSVRVRFGWTRRGDRYTKRQRAIFSYRGSEYEIEITDPVFLHHHRKAIPKKGAPTNQFEVAGKEGLHLCVSLAPAFRGFHYKLAATIFESEG